MYTILIVDDDVYIGDMLEEILAGEGYKTARAYSGTEALMYLSSSRPDLVLLDLMLPGLSGEELLPLIKGIPVIVVSARAETSDKVDLLLGGASDYVTKPFDTAELLARIAVQLRKGVSSDSGSVLAFHSLRLNTDSREVTVSGAPVRLTQTEYAILKLLMRNPSQVITKSLMLERISEDTPDCTENSLKVHISNLRRKLKSVDGNDYIEAVWGIGFKLNEEIVTGES
ncbi:response regulator transcription factor [Ruminococcus sp. CLA-AA-H200]|uniref:Stage 0 sporulation protein A homolog n=1 Tax=Ruminococcus turbiniformis TaxID=2881258 RepID=A0ABS8FY39_9FIRM|nr:response regulator transcription factor [Ruminococcus turbiniformis]MCC2254509.1 response regulator transcription factor [Ruminococcus turbiniformis]